MSQAQGWGFTLAYDSLFFLLSKCKVWRITLLRNSLSRNNSWELYFWNRTPSSLAAQKEKYLFVWKFSSDMKNCLLFPYTNQNSLTWKILPNLWGIYPPPPRNSFWKQTLPEWQVGLLETETASSSNLCFLRRTTISGGNLLQWTFSFNTARVYYPSANTSIRLCLWIVIVARGEFIISK